MNYVNGFNPPSQPNPPAPKKNRVPIILAIVAACLIVLVLFFAVVGFVVRSTTSGLSRSEGGLDIVRIEGTIAEDAGSSLWAVQEYSQTYIMDTLQNLIDSDASKAILLYIDSPGGAIYQTDDVYLKLLEYKETGRPVYAYMAQTAASGGYYIACAADKVYCNRNTLTGSIGVIYGTFMDFSQFLEKYGVETHTFTSGANKSMGSSYEPMTEQQKEIFQSIVDEAYEQFVDVVATGRGMEKSAVYPIADGRVYTAMQALDAGLVDEIAPYEDALEAIKAELGDSDMPVTDHRQSYGSPLGSLFASIAELRGRSEAEVILDVVTAYNKTGYYCAELAR